MSETNPQDNELNAIGEPDRKPTEKEAQTAAAALSALNEGNVTQAQFLNKLLKMTQEDNDKEAQDE